MRRAEELKCVLMMGKSIIMARHGQHLMKTVQNVLVPRTESSVVRELNVTYPKTVVWSGLNPIPAVLSVLAVSNDDDTSYEHD